MEKTKCSLFVIGLALILGAFGGLDCETLSLSVGMIISVIGISLMAASAILEEMK